MLFRLLISSIPHSLILFILRLSGMHSKRLVYTLLQRRKHLCLSNNIVKNSSNLHNTMKTGLWRIGKGCCGQMRQRLTGLGQMRRCMFGNNEGNQYLTGLQHQLLNMEGGIVRGYSLYPILGTLSLYSLYISSTYCMLCRLTPSCISHLPIILVVSPTRLSSTDSSILVIYTPYALIVTSHIRIYVHTHVVYRCKVVIEDNHLGIRLDSWVLHLSLSVL